MSSADNFFQQEYDRLMKKDEVASKLASSQNRLTMLNDSYRKRYSKYIQMLMVLVLAYIVYLATSLIQKSAPGIPTYVFDFIYVALIFLVVYYMFFAMTTIFNRNETNYDEINVAAIGVDGSGVDAQAILEAGQISPVTTGTNVCVGQSCCPNPAWVWDQTSNKCIVPATPTRYPGCGSFDGKYMNPMTGNCVSWTQGSGFGTSSNAPAQTFTTLEYSTLERQSDTNFNDPSLKRVPNAENVQSLYSDSNLHFSSV
jgi:hypothetical protein